MFFWNKGNFIKQMKGSRPLQVLHVIVLVALNDTIKYKKDPVLLRIQCKLFSARNK
jgi:hypothetical protein